MSFGRVYAGFTGDISFLTIMTFREKGDKMLPKSVMLSTYAYSFAATDVSVLIHGDISTQWGHVTYIDNGLSPVQRQVIM